MTAEGDNKAESFFSKLRRRSTIIFTIGLAISVASFVDNLHMGRDAIDYVVAQLSTIRGWEDFVRSAATIFHATLEWWRGVLRDLLSFLPFHVPQWLHDPLSLVLFGVARVWSRRDKWKQIPNRPASWKERWKGRARQKSYEFDTFSLFSEQVMYVLAVFIMPMVALIVTDGAYFGAYGDLDSLLAHEPIVVALCGAVIVLFVISWYYAMRRAMRAEEEAYRLREAGE